MSLSVAASSDSHQQRPKHKLKNSRAKTDLSHRPRADTLEELDGGHGFQSGVCSI
jgi:hypothetical protein